MDANFFAGVATALGSVLIGFLLAVAWDVVKLRREGERQDEAVVRVLREELVRNSAILGRNRGLLDEELKVLGQNQSVVNPMEAFERGSWDLLRSHIPARLVEDSQTLSSLSKVDHLSVRANTVIASREAYRLTNAAMSNFHTRMRKYDEAMMAFVNELGEAMKQLPKF